jgi:hypothetical protein
VSQPLVPLGGDLDVRVGRGRGVADDAAHAMLVRVERVAEFPKGVTLQVEAWGGGQLGVNGDKLGD